LKGRKILLYISWFDLCLLYWSWICWKIWHL